MCKIYRKTRFLIYPLLKVTVGTWQYFVSSLKLIGMLGFTISLVSACKTIQGDGVIKKTAGEGLLGSLQDCTLTSKLLPPSSLNPASLPTTPLTKLTITRSSHASIDLINLPSLDGADAVYMEACRDKSIYCFDKILRSPRTLEHRFLSGSDYEVALRLCVRADRAHVKDDSQKVSPTESPGRDYYCSNAHVINYRHQPPTMPPDEDQSIWSRLSQQEGELIQKLGLIVSTTEHYVNASSSPPAPLLAQVQNVLGLRDGIYGLALSPIYDIAYATVTKHLAAEQAGSPSSPTNFDRPSKSKAVVRNFPNYCAYSTDITAVDHLLKNADDIKFLESSLPDLPKLSDHQQGRAAVYTLLALGAVVSATGEHNHRELSFHDLQAGLFASLTSLSTHHLHSAARPAAPHPLLFGVGGRFVALYDQALLTYFKSEFGFEQERQLYNRFYAEMETYAASFHRLRQRYLDLRRNAMTP